MRNRIDPIARRMVISWTTAILLTAVSTAPVGAVDLVRDGRSRHVIYHAPDAPSSVAAAAADLQAYVAEASGAWLEIVTEPRQPMIALGDSPAAKAAGIDVAAIPLEGFRILTRGDSIYIVGPDTADGQHTPGGGTSAGTRNGVDEFLERFVGVRWLVPGERGDYVPRSKTIVVPETDLSDAPFFHNRRVPYTQERRPEVKQWWARQRLGWSLYLSHGHNWRSSIPAALYDEHPDWFAERGGVRVPPSGRYKLCITNPSLIQAYADAAIARFDAQPELSSYSLSPSDSAGWCECENCRALYEKDPNGNLSVTPAVLTFYNEVGKRVAEKHLDKLLAGYVYGQYVFPPSKPIELQPNVFLVWAPSFDYGFTLFRPQLQRQWEELLLQWTAVTENIAYYDLPVKITTEAGALNPPGLKILKFLYPRLKAARIKGVYVYGIEAWGRGGPLNYLLAKLAWDPEADVEALFDEYCDKAYGAGADEINRLLRLLDAEVERHFLANANARYTLTTEMMTDIYAANLPEIERLYRAAEAKVRDPDAKARLEMIGANLTVLHWSLRQFKLLDDPQASSFYLSDAEFFEFLSARRDSLALQPRRDRTSTKALGRYAVAPVERVPNAEPVRRFLLRGNQHLLIYPQDGVATIRFSSITSRGKLVTYAVRGADGAEIDTGLMSAEVPLQLDPAGSAYYHVIITAGSASFAVAVENAAWAVAADGDRQGLHFLARATPLYFHMPEGPESFHFSLAATPPGETAVARLYRPDGTEAAAFDCSAVPVDRQAVPARAGWWKLVIEAAPTGVLDDVWVKPGEEAPGWFSLDPEHALEVTRLEE